MSHILQLIGFWSFVLIGVAVSLACVPVGLAGIISLSPCAEEIESTIVYKVVILMIVIGVAGGYLTDPY